MPQSGQMMQVDGTWAAIYQEPPVIAVIIPAYKVEKQITRVVANIPQTVKR